MRPYISAVVAATVICVVLAVASIASAKATGPSASTASPSASVRVPNLRGKKLPLAEVLLRHARLGIGREDCDCTFGVVVKSSGFVCMQWPAAGRLVRPGTRVATYSVRDMLDC